MHSFIATFNSRELVHGKLCCLSAETAHIFSDFGLRNVTSHLPCPLELPAFTLFRPHRWTLTSSSCFGPNVKG
jgi:hypothetical protein